SGTQPILDAVNGQYLKPFFIGAPPAMAKHAYRFDRVRGLPKAVPGPVQNNSAPETGQDVITLSDPDVAVREIDGVAGHLSALIITGAHVLVALRQHS